MRITRHCYRLFYTALLTVGVLAQAACVNDVGSPSYPPGSNMRNATGSLYPYEFRPGCWSDSKRYWPEATSCLAPVPSRPIPNEPPAIYQWECGTSHWSRAD
jgi:hypothetical protein